MQAGFGAGEKAAEFFRNTPGGHGLIQAALSGQGRVLVDNPVHPGCALAAVGDFLFCAGELGPEAPHMLRRVLAGQKDWLIYAPGGWMQAVKSILPVRMQTRIAFGSHQPEDTHLHHLLKAMPNGGTFQLIENEWITRCQQEKWSRDFVSVYTDEDFRQRGLGVLLMVDGHAVAGASSYVSYPGGIEVQLQTRDDQQGRGYATLAAAKLILMAHQRGLAATWDAANPASAHIAEKLGYRRAGLYEVAATGNEEI